MKHMLRYVSLVSALVGLSSASFAASGEVFVSGSTWTGRVDGSTKYTGTNMAAAVNACVANMSSGTIVLKNSGTKNGTMSIKSNITIDGTGRTVSGAGTTGVVYAQNSSTIGGRNVLMNSTDWYGMFFRTCNGQNVTGTGGTAGIGFRIDNCKGGTGYNLTVGSSTSSGSGSSHYLETYGISGVSWGTISATNRGHCGVLLNKSTSSSGTAVNGNRCGNGTGYAAFRTANDNLGPTTLGTVNATNGCGRGFYSTTNSRNTTITTVNASDCTGIGIWLG
jgi:hypothetical protein